MSLDNIDPCYCEREDSADDRPWNAAGQDAVEYRVSRHPLAKKRMLRRISTESFDVKVIKDNKEDTEPGPDVLAGLTTREDSDPTIALIDAWAVACDVLSFYDERITNEGFLRTATERRSILELAREIGYELNPGASATAYLAFTVDDGPLSPGELTVPAGLPVMHVPQKEELPQTFETSEETYIKATWNELRPELETRQVLLSGSMVKLVIDGPLPEVKAGDYLVLQPDDEGAGPEVELVKTTSFDTTDGKTTLTIEGVGSIVWGVASEGVKDVDATGITEAEAFGSVLGASITEKSLQSHSKYVNMSLPEFEAASIGYVTASVTRRQPDPPIPPSGAATSLNPGVYGFKYRTANFGHNAPPYASLPSVMRTGKTDPEGELIDPIPPFPTPYENNHVGAGYSAGWPGSADLFLERVFSDLMPGEPLLIQKTGGDPDLWQIEKSIEATVADYTLSGKATGLVVVSMAAEGQATPTVSGYTLRQTSIMAGAFALPLSTLPVADNLVAGSTSIKLGSEVTGLSVGRYVVLTGELAEWPGVVRSELLVLDEPLHDVGQSTLRFTSGLQNSYNRSSVKICANVVPATHGETVTAEILGSADASTAFARYALKKPPLTHVPAPTATGSESTLSVYVNDVLWKPTSNWYTLKPKDRAYRVTIDDDGKTWVGFGDGARGARPPTGDYNIVANYRTGTGSGGQVAAETITLLKKKPLGVRSVTNKLAAEGGVDLESRDDARTNAPKTVLTMGYVVSSTDLENFARAFAGVGKALATEVVIASQPTVLLTLASSAGTVFATTTTTDAFKEAVKQFGEPSVRFLVSSFHPRVFGVKCALTVDSACIAEKVVAAVESALLSAFSFAERCFGQNVAFAEVVAVIQRVEGVLMVDLEPLTVTPLLEGEEGTATVVGSTIVAQKAGWDSVNRSILEPALVTIDPFAVEVKVDT